MRIRITFSKQGPLRYTGHLDLHKLWERAARRAELPLAYSQGFHPQPKMNLASALPLGFSSRCEVLDMRLEHAIALEGLSERLNNTLPAGLQVLNVEQVEERAPALQTQVVSAEYEVRMIDSGFREDTKRRIESVDSVRRVLSATVVRSIRSNASYTTPMPPSPRRRISRNRPPARRGRPETTSTDSFKTTSRSFSPAKCE